MPPYRERMIINPARHSRHPSQDNSYINSLSTRVAHSHQPLTPLPPPNLQRFQIPIPQASSTFMQTRSLDRNTRLVMDSAVTAKTRQRKLRYCGEFLDWAEKQGLRECDVLPPSESLLCNYTASMAGKISGGTARAKLSAVKSWVQRKGLVWHGLDNLRNTLSGVERKAPRSSFREQRPPVKAEHLQSLVSKLNLDEQNGLDYAIRAGATACFFGQLRAGEIFSASSDDPKDYDFTQLPVVKNLGPANEAGDRKLHLPKTKVSQAQGETIILTTQQGGISPTRALREHIRVNCLRPDDPLLAYRDTNNELKVLSKTLFLRRCNEVWSAMGIPKMTGHCFRIGGTTHFLVAGIPPDVVKALGRWKSDAFLRYWRDLDSLASIHLH